MAKKSYWDLLRDPRWQRKRLEIMERAGFECEDCGCDDTTLNVHHSYYEKGMNPWDYPDLSLHCLCEPCHEKAQEVLRKLHRQIGRLSLTEIEVLLGIARGLELEQEPYSKSAAENYDVLSGMVRVFLTLNGRVVSRCTDRVGWILEDAGSKEVSGLQIFEVCEQFGVKE